MTTLPFLPARYVHSFLIRDWRSAQRTEVGREAVLGCERILLRQRRHNLVRFRQPIRRLVSGPKILCVAGHVRSDNNELSTLVWVPSVAGLKDGR